VQKSLEEGTTASALTS